jgi:hypothetical protein
LGDERRWLVRVRRRPEVRGVQVSVEHEGGESLRPRLADQGCGFARRRLAMISTIEKSVLTTICCEFGLREEALYVGFRVSSFTRKR